ncbi:MAG: homoserine kinase [Tissierellia bacterium]|nr:homoserine kinase [Tissierellia bacterium]
MIEIRVPASTANLGPGFDALGLALDLNNTYRFKEIEAGLEIYGVDEKYNNSDNLIYTSMLTTFRKLGYSPKGLRIDVESEIPISSGLGSSAACIVAGVMGANFLAGEPLSKEEIFSLATEIEGHPDNIAPAIFGGLIVSIIEDGKVYYNKMDIKEGIKFIVILPDFTVSTREARKVLPDQISYQDGVFNVGRVALLLSALSNGRFDLLRPALNDRLHQPYRSKLIKGFDLVIDKCVELGSYGAYLSGAGPSIMAIADRDDEEFVEKMKEYLGGIGYNWHVKEMEINLTGATMKKIP